MSAYRAGTRALSLTTIETPFFGLGYPRYTGPQVAYWHLTMHMHVDITRMLVEGREEQYLRHFFRDFAYHPAAMPESEVQQYITQMRSPGTLRGGLQPYGYIPQMAAQTAELTKDIFAAATEKGVADLINTSSVGAQNIFSHLPIRPVARPG